MMIGRRRLIRAWWPVLIWMTVIFIGSTDVLSSRQTSRIIGPLLRWINPDISDEMIKRVQTFVRKGGHLTEFAILAMLCWRAGHISQVELTPGWSWRNVAVAFSISILYAISDEVHQTFSSSRMGSPMDVLIDAVGVVFGLTLIWTWGRWRDYW